MSRRSIQRDRYWEKTKLKAERTGQGMAVLLMASPYKKHREYATTILNNARAAVEAAGVELPKRG